MKRILIADDNEHVVDVVKEGLETHGYTVIVARDGKEALEKIRTYKPDIVILDILMPEMDGVTIASNLKLDVETRQIPIIYLTGFIDKEKETQFQSEIQSAVFLTKPFTIPELISVINSFA